MKSMWIGIRIINVVLKDSNISIIVKIMNNRK